MKTKETLLALTVGLLLSTSISAQDILLGQSTSTRRADLHRTDDYTRGAEAYFDSINARGGIGGRRIVLTTLDDGDDAAKSAQHTSSFISDPRVLALFGYSSLAATAALPLSQEAKIPLIGIPDGAESLRAQANRYVFNTRASQTDEAELILRYLRQVPNTRIAVAHSNTPEGRSGLVAIEKALGREGDKLVSKVDLNLGAKSAEAIATTRPDSIVVVGDQDAVAAFVKQYKTLSVPTQFLVVSSSPLQMLVKSLGADAEGVVLSRVVPPPTAKKYRIVSEYLDALKGKNLTPSHASLEGFVAAKVLVEGLRRGGSASRESLARALEAMQRVDIGDVIVAFDPTRRTLSSYVELVSLNRRGEVRY